eukprot:TRINITY_DN9589_c1_g2_i1.p1 TRINITY_DN9589_c1_g2~~TRINITY_DN9589_c1_g2_i1.p1  ORF type:complete len:104 (+),score=13.71 TRINITY_DN9589_c1_g2_i1:1603-1914(+)
MTREEVRYWGRPFHCTYYGHKSCQGDVLIRKNGLTFLAHAHAFNVVPSESHLAERNELRVVNFNIIYGHGKVPRTLGKNHQLKNRFHKVSSMHLPLTSTLHCR